MCSSLATWLCLCTKFVCFRRLRRSSAACIRRQYRYLGTGMPHMSRQSMQGMIYRQGYHGARYYYVTVVFDLTSAGVKEPYCSSWTWRSFAGQVSLERPRKSWGIRDCSETKDDNAISSSNAHCGLGRTTGEALITALMNARSDSHFCMHRLARNYRHYKLVRDSGGRVAQEIPKRCHCARVLG